MLNSHFTVHKTCKTMRFDCYLSIDKITLTDIDSLNNIKELLEVEIDHSRTNGNKRDETELNKTMSYEVGHQIGMAPTGQCQVGMKRNPIYTYSIGSDIGLDKGVPNKK